MIDTTHRLNIPNRHPLHAAGTKALEEADVILLLDVKNADLQLAKEHRHERGMRLRVAPTARIIDVGFHDLHVTAWVQDFGAIVEADLRVLADTRTALPALVEQVRALCLADSPDRVQRRADHRLRLKAAHDERWAGWAAEADASGEVTPVATSWLAREVWSAIQGTDWVLGAGTAGKWVPRLWDFDTPYRHAGLRVDAANQIGTAIGVALAHRGSNRLVVDIQPDGDLMYDLGALWIASAHAIPLLVVMFNNHAYYNDFGHQSKVAEMRGSDRARIPVGITLEPSPDYARVAEGLGWHSEGPVTDPARVREAVARAANVVLEEGRPALVDVMCQPR
jgi:benzoylformate decarboxylase/acetolactate synthase-1/2/3 large subunit